MFRPFAKKTLEAYATLFQETTDLMDADVDAGAPSDFFFRGKNNVISVGGVIFFCPKDPDPCLEED